MSLAIRLSRGGAKKRPYYRIVVTDSRSPRDGRFIEKIGIYNPLLAKDSPERVKLDTDRISHWLSVGAQPSDRVLRFLDAAGIKERAARNNPEKAQPGDKAKERAKARAAREAELAEAAAAPVEAEEAAAEQPVAKEAAAETDAVEETPAAAEEAPTAEQPAEEATAEKPTPADEATNEDRSANEPAEGSVEDAPAEGAETAEKAE